MLGRAILVAIPAWLAAVGIAFAQDEAYVDLELVLAVDISRSMDFDEQRVQREGYVDAFRHRDVIDAITSGAAGRIVVTYLEWAGIGTPKVVVPWTIVDGPESAAVFAEAMDAAPVTRLRGTSISGGLHFAADQFDQNEFFGERQIIDVSGDGPNNMGVPVVPVRDEIVGRGIVINGLPVMIRPSPTLGAYNIPNLDIYYEDCVIGGPGSFVITVEDPSKFAVAIRRKLVLEIAGRDLPVVPVAMRDQPRIDCLIGEKLRRMWFNP